MALGKAGGRQCCKRKGRAVCRRGTVGGPLVGWRVCCVHLELSWVLGPVRSKASSRRIRELWLGRCRRRVFRRGRAVGDVWFRLGCWRNACSDT